MENEIKLPELTAEEVRVLGVLIEKSRTTPDYYPLTLNSLLTACNQKSARNPVVDYEQHEVLEAIDGLKKKGLLAHVLGDGRTTKYRHTIAVKYSLDPAEITVIGLLLLRGPLTVGEIKNMSGRMYDFDDLEEVQKVIGALKQAENPYISQMERKTGQKEARYFHLFAPLNLEESSWNTSTLSGNNQELAQRISFLEEEVASLRKIIEEFIG